ncbi:unnamed protein product [Clonostachys byssicola]|uniref:Uncharacterized protein n=1 Tax=Clonostachys byssicola TaxID=160290 RepID=A0A9N9ULP3_9HYPO|nr:unnamed protein product [Clonostachys byssicola]
MQRYLFVLAFLSTVAYTAPSVEIVGFRSLPCPFNVSANILAGNLALTYDTSTLSSNTGFVDEHICTIHVELSHDPKNDRMFVTDIDVTGDADAELDTLLAWDTSPAPT